jgi:ribosomal protein S18 acetylase RimI-like enzyme
LDLAAQSSIRIATAADARALSELLWEFNGEALPADELSRRIEQAQGLETAFLAERNGEVLGLLVLRTTPTLSSPDDWAEITELYVRPTSRRTGVGRALVERALEHSRSHGCTEIHLLVDPSNLAALSFYEALGFHRDSWEMRRAS